MDDVPRVEDEDDSRYVYEGFGPLYRPEPERRRLQRFMQRVVRDVLAHEDEYGSLRDPLVLLAENYARTCQSEQELTRRLANDSKDADERGAAARLLMRTWEAERSASAP